VAARSNIQSAVNRPVPTTRRSLLLQRSCPDGLIATPAGAAATRESTPKAANTGIRAWSIHAAHTKPATVGSVIDTFVGSSSMGWRTFPGLRLSGLSSARSNAPRQRPANHAKAPGGSASKQSRPPRPPAHALLAESQRIDQGDSNSKRACRTPSRWVQRKRRPTGPHTRPRTTRHSRQSPRSRSTLLDASREAFRFWV